MDNIDRDMIKSANEDLILGQSEEEKKRVKYNERTKKTKVAMRKKEVTRLRLMGLTYREISDYMWNKYADTLPSSYDHRWIAREVKDILDETRYEVNENAKQLKQLEVDRLDGLLSAIMPSAMSGNLKAVDRVLKIMERRAKMVGLDEPNKVRVHDWRSEVIELINSGKITIEQVKSELGDNMAKMLLSSGNVIDGSFKAFDSSEAEVDAEVDV